MALVTSLPGPFKRIKASVSAHDMIGTLSQTPRLLIASFEVNNIATPVMIDTGATISILPENGKIMKNGNFKIIPTNLNVKLADEAITHVNKKVELLLRPASSKHKPQVAAFYIANGSSSVFGFDALLGLNVLRMFNLDITIQDQKVRIYHEGKCIGRESTVPENYNGSIKVDERFSQVRADSTIIRMLKLYKGVFTDLDQQPIYGPPMRILTVHQRPIFAKQRHYNIDEIVQMKTHIKSLLDKGIIEPTKSGYAATSRIIPKKSGAGRLVVNYIPLNAITLRDSYALPHVADILGVLQGKKYFSTMDCTQGFYQILVDQRDRPKTGFSTPVGNFQFVRCPFGARNSCAVFQAEMNRIFADGLYTRCVIYVDDILVFGRDREEHDENLEWVLSQCQKYNVKLKLEKCSFARTEVKYLGFSISGEKIKPLSEKVDSLSLSNPPKDKTELRSVIGKLNFYSRFIPNYSRLLEPLRELFRKNRDFQWQPHHQAAYKDTLAALKTAPAQLLMPRADEKIIEIHNMPDSLEVLVLSKEEQLMHRASRFLSSAEQNYSLVERQLLGMVLALNKFRIWLDPERTIIRVPSNQLEKTLKMINRPERVENLLLKLPDGFDTFKFEVKESLIGRISKAPSSIIPQEIYYIDGACKLNGKPNCQASWAVCAEFDRELASTGLVDESPSNNAAELTAAIRACEIAKEKGFNEIAIVTDSKYLHSAATSWIDKWKNNEWLDHKKRPVVNIELFKQLLHAKKDLKIEWIHVKGHADNLGNIRADSLARAELDKNAEILCSAAEQARRVQDDSPEIEQVRKQIRQGERQGLIEEDGKIYFIDKRLPEQDQKRIYVPQESRGWLLKLAHDDPIYGGHLGIKKTHRKLIRFWWPRMHHDVDTYVRTCDICQRFKNPTGLPPGYLNSIPVSSIFEHVHLDIVGPIKQTYRGNTYIITATDAFSKWAFARSCQNIRTSEIIKFMEECILSLHGKPKVIITDQGTQFTSGEWKSFIDRIGAEHNLTAPYHPQSNGIDERLNGTLVRILRAYVDEHQSDWDEYLKWALYVYNTTVHESTGFKPYQILHGMDPRSPLSGSMRINKSDQEEIERIRRYVRRKADELNRRSQETQAREYNSRHRQCRFRVGDLVLAREQTTPSHLSKKFFPKWFGPCVITHAQGDEENPRAVKILDCVYLTTKTVSIRDIKPYNSRSDNESLSSINEGVSKEKGEAQEPLEDTKLYSSKYFVDEPLIKLGDEPKNSANDRYSLDLSLLSGQQPISSSPRRVTIADQPETFFYPADSPIVCSDLDSQDDTLTGSDTPGPPVVLAEPINDPVMRNRPDTPMRAPSNTRYVMEYIMDDSRVDPTYKPATNRVRMTDRVLRSQGPADERYLPIRMRSWNNQSSTVSDTTTDESGRVKPSNPRPTKRTLVTESPGKLIEADRSVEDGEKSDPGSHDETVCRDTTDEEFHDTVSDEDTILAEKH